MQATTITTFDQKNNAEYTTTDKLYLPMADGFGSSYTVLKAGQNNDKLLAMNIYWNQGGWFWTRAADPALRDYALAVFQTGYAFNLNVDYGTNVYPASNLDLSSVIFSSAAQAASSDAAVSGIIADGTAMIMRMDGSDKDIGTVAYDASGTITATRGSVPEAVALVVQGNDGTNDWYYSRQITGQETVDALDIKNTLNLSEDIVLSDCKIWLETTEDRVAYAVDAVKIPELISITNPQPITGLANGTAKTVSALGLPSTVTIVTESTDITTAEVIWDLENLVSGSYDKDVRTEQTFTLKGIVVLPKTITNSSHIPLEVTLTVTVNAGDVVVTPVIVPKNDTPPAASQTPLTNTNLNSPKTADTAGTVFWSTVLLTVLAGITGMARLKKRNAR